MRKQSLKHVAALGIVLAVGLAIIGADRSVAAGQDPPTPQEPARGRGRGAGGAAIIGGVVPGAGRGRGAAAPLDPGGVQRRRLDLDTVIFTDAKGMTLYTYQKDTPGQSACAGACATNWPPLVAAADATASGDWTIVTRADGTRQWAHLGRPLYTFVKDTKPGETAGDGAGGSAWRAAAAFVPYVRPAK
jgi:predicted lipoprotein with Yx(FWY)xxD motif